MDTGFPDALQQNQMQVVPVGFLVQRSGGGQLCGGICGFRGKAIFFQQGGNPAVVVVEAMTALTIVDLLLMGKNAKLD